jgi:hypothetical protein
VKTTILAPGQVRKKCTRRARQRPSADQRRPSRCEFLFESGLRSRHPGRKPEARPRRPGMEQRDRAGRLEASVDDPMEIKPLARSEFHGNSRTACPVHQTRGRPEAPLGRPDAARRPTPGDRPERPAGHGTDALEHDPEKWKPVFRKDHAQTGG